MRTSLAILITVAVLTSACGHADGRVAGSGTIAGSIDGRAFDSVAAAYLIGKPDDPDRTTVIYVFDAPIACSAISSTGWDEKVTDATQSLEMKLIGQSPGVFPIPADGTPATGEADVNYTLTSTSGTPSEISATVGSVVLDALEAETSATGSFDLAFPGGTLTGSFETGWCADAHEP